MKIYVFLATAFFVASLCIFVGMGNTHPTVAKPLPNEGISVIAQATLSEGESLSPAEKRLRELGLTANPKESIKLSVREPLVETQR